MQKVVGSSPIIRSKSPARRQYLLSVVGTHNLNLVPERSGVLTHPSPNQPDTSATRPGLLGKQLSAFATARIGSDHEVEGELSALSSGMRFR
jgi:hypothetical protein